MLRAAAAALPAICTPHAYRGNTVADLENAVAATQASQPAGEAWAGLAWATTPGPRTPQGSGRRRTLHRIPKVTEQRFGPTLPIHRYSTMDEAVAKANGLDAGLGASVCSAALAVPQAING